MKDIFKLNDEKLTDVEKNIYQFMRSEWEFLPYMRIRDVAGKAHVSTTSILRYLKKIGYESFSEFKMEVKKEIEQNHEVQDSLVLDFDILNRKNFNQDLEYQIEKVSKKILASDDIVLFGIGTSGILGEYGARKLVNIGLNAMSISDHSYPINSHFSSDKKTLLMVLSVSGQTKETVEMLLSISEKANVEKICITSNATGEIAKLSDYTIDYFSEIYKQDIYYDLTSQLPVMFILDLLIKKITTIKTACS